MARARKGRGKGGRVIRPDHGAAAAAGGDEDGITGADGVERLRSVSFSWVSLSRRRVLQTGDCAAAAGVLGRQPPVIIGLAAVAPSVEPTPPDILR